MRQMCPFIMVLVITIHVTDCHTLKREVKSNGAKTCQELGPNLANLDSPFFDHMLMSPQCLEIVQPKLTLYTQNKSSNGCLLSTLKTSVGNSYFDIPSNCKEELYKLQKVVFLIHGFSFLGEQPEEFKDMKTEILNAEEAGVIIVDWFEGAKVDLSFLRNSTSVSMLGDFVNLAPYQQAAANTRYVGAALAVVTDNIRSISHHNLTTHCIGHSLGAHTCGFLGKALNKTSSPPLDRIIGLDPTGPLFLDSHLAADMEVPYYSTSSHLDRGDALLVDTIHTDSNWLGSFTKTGYHDFYVGKSKTTNDGKREDSYGYNQPGVKECFIGSHNLAKDIFLAMIEEQDCIVNKVCTNININVTAGCQEVEGVKFGYRLDGVSSMPGNFLVSSDKGIIRCNNGKTIKLPPSSPSLLVKMLANIRFDFCSFIRGITGPIRELGKTMNYLLQESKKRLEAKKVALKEKLDELIKNAKVLGRTNAELFAIHQKMLQINNLYAQERRRLIALAKRTTRDSKTIVKFLNEIMTKGSQAEVNPKLVVSRVSKLISTSKRKLQEAADNLKSIEESYTEISSKLHKLENKISTAADAVVEYGEDLKKGIKKTKTEQFNFLDKVETAAIGGGFIGAGIFNLVNGGVEVGMACIINGVRTMFKEYVEWDEEKKTIALFEVTKNATDILLQKYDMYSRKINDTRLTVKNKLEGLKTRLGLIEKWREVVEAIIDNWGDDDYELLMQSMNMGKTILLEEAITDFEDLYAVAQDYLDFDKNAVKVTVKGK